MIEYAETIAKEIFEEEEQIKFAEIGYNPKLWSEIPDHIRRTKIHAVYACMNRGLVIPGLAVTQTRSGRVIL